MHSGEILRRCEVFYVGVKRAEVHEGENMEGLERVTERERRSLREMMC